MPYVAAIFLVGGILAQPRPLNRLAVMPAFCENIMSSENYQDPKTSVTVNQPQTLTPAQNTPSQFKYDAFLSYHSKTDYNNARKLEAFLEAIHRTPVPVGAPIRPLQICRDGSDFRLPARRDNLPTSDDPIWEIIRTHLANSRYLIVLCSPGAVKSVWVARELQWMLENRGPDWVLPVLTNGEEPVEKPAEYFPEPIRAAGINRTRIWYDLRGLPRTATRSDVRDYEDERVRLAGDLLEWDADKYGQLAALWQREQLRQRRRQATLISIGACVLLVLGIVAIWQGVRTRQEARRARANALVLAADSSFDPLTSTLLLAELDDDYEPDDGMRVAQRVAGSMIPLSVLRGHTGRLLSITFSPDRQHVLTSSQDGTIRLWPVEGRSDPIVFPGGTNGKGVAVFSPDGRMVGSAGEDGTTRVWSIDVTQPVRTFRHD